MNAPLRHNLVFRKLYDAAKQTPPPTVSSTPDSLASSAAPPPAAAPPVGFAGNTCARCGVGFRMTSDLVYHMRTHHSRRAAAKAEAGQAGPAGGTGEEGR